MGLDVVACFYKQDLVLPFFERGIVANMPPIDHVYVVSDGPWEKQPAARPGWTFLWHPKSSGHGVAESFNQGARASKSDYLLFLAVDVVLQPGAAQLALDEARKGKLAIGAVDSIAMDSRLDEYPDFRITREDMNDRYPRFELFRACNKEYLLARNGHTCVGRKAFIWLGGFDPRFSTAGYGFEDYEFGVRWCEVFGGSTIVKSGGRAGHFEPALPVSVRQHKRGADDAAKLLTRRAIKLHGGRLALFAAVFSPTECCVGHVEEHTSPDTMAIDCNDLSWIDPLSLTFLSTYPMLARNPSTHILDCWGKVAVAGALRLNGVTDDRLLDVLGTVELAYAGNEAVEIVKAM